MMVAVMALSCGRAITSGGRRGRLAGRRVCFGLASQIAWPGKPKAVKVAGRRQIIWAAPDRSKANACLGFIAAAKEYIPCQLAFPAERSQKTLNFQRGSPAAARLHFGVQIY
jgi:hypothetical protein